MEEHRRYIEECQQCGDEAILENHHNDMCQCNQGLLCPYYKNYARCPECYSLYFDDYTDYDSNSDFGNDEYSDDNSNGDNGNDDNSNSDNDSDDTSSIISAASTVRTK